MNVPPEIKDAKSRVRENEQRVAYLERLYLLDGRDNPGHPMHRLYTGLLQNRQQVLMELDRMEQLRKS